ncbi:hypothetical protein RhiirA4_407350 [Rhizophagus irregularis]|uniref:Uncharacterized protein n=1 Tax=Rhizophagus irregularis TaxID=588596 RepID=A0A2I1GXJ2_9GLOM|nr:hypothetical protein RhiirA4_407350 [Rhizophagus irregularis]
MNLTTRNNKTRIISDILPKFLAPYFFAGRFAELLSVLYALYLVTVVRGKIKGTIAEDTVRKMIIAIV